MSIDLELVLAFSRDLQSASTLGELVEAMRKAVAGSTRYRTMWLAAFESGPDGEWVRILATSGTAQEIIWEETPRFPVGTDAMLLEIRDGRKPVVVEDMRTDPRTDKEIVARAGHRTTINVPLLLGEAVLGALGVSSFGDEGIMPPTPSELEHLTVCATLLAAALDRVRLLEQKRAADLQGARLQAEHRVLEAQLRQAQKMEVVGTLAGGIAHDFNNLLMAVLGHAQLVRDSMLAADWRRESMDTIISSGKRAAHLTRNLLIFSRKQVVSSMPVSIQSVIGGVEALLRPLLREDIELRTELPDRELVVQADAGELEQVLLNLVNNARDAMPDGGTVTIRASETTIDDDFVTRHGAGTLGKCALLTVSDTGLGMSASTQEKIFEPFFTTKEPGKGTGLGLATSYGIVKQLGGHIFVESVLGRGTTFEIYLPLTTEAVVSALSGDGAAATRGTETILVAEDEEAVRKLVTGLLRSHGYRVLEAVDGQDAIDKFRAHSAEIDLVLTDVVMPKRSGRDVYDTVRAFRQDTEVVFTSGYAPEEIGLPEGGPQTIVKPVGPTELLATIRRVLDRRR